MKIGLSVGSKALPALREAIKHAEENPTHNPIFFADQTLDQREPDPKPRYWWVCRGEDDAGENPTRLCTYGGDFP